MSHGTGFHEMKHETVLTFDLKLGLVKFQLSLFFAEFFFQVLVLQRKLDVTKQVNIKISHKFRKMSNM